MKLLVALLLAAAAVAGLLAHLRRHGAREPAAWLSPAVALLLWLALFPPAPSEPAQRLAVLTPGTPPDRPLPPAPRVALPGVEHPQLARAQRVPDLATALRRYPQARALEVLGHGLPERDRPAAQGLRLDFTPPPLHGIVAVTAPAQSHVGRLWSVDGRVEGEVGRVELLGPANERLDEAVPDAQRGFTLAAPLRGSGPVAFTLRALAPDGAVVDRLSLPVLVLPSPPQPRVLLRAATPDADLKYLRRWAADAGIALEARIGLSTDLALNAGAAPFTPAALAAADLAIVDERTWTQLDAAEQQALRAAVQGGLGLLLRATGAPEPTVLAGWQSLGFSGLRVLDAAPPVVLEAAGALQLAPLALDTQGALLLGPQTLGGEWLGVAVPLGRGRVGLWRLLDSYALRLGGEPARHATLWADLLSALVRPAPAPPAPPAVGLAHQGLRARVCNLAADARRQPSGRPPQPLQVASDGCALWWPEQPGWTTLVSAAGEQHVYVRGADDARALRAAQDREATKALAAAGAPPGAGFDTPRPWPRWPFAGLWLLGAGWLWWRERQLAAAG